MAIGDIEIKVDRFLTDTRVVVCMNRNCIHMQKDAFLCQFKEIELNENGMCSLKDDGDNPY